MKTVLYFTIALLAITSCRETEVPIEKLTTDVSFNLIREKNSELLKGGDVNRNAISDDLIRRAIKGFTVQTTHRASNTPKQDYFNVLDQGGASKIEIEDVMLGINRFNIVTTPYPETIASDPVPDDADGFSSYAGWMNSSILEAKKTEQNLTDVTNTTDMTTVLRALVPDVIFMGHKETEIKVEDNSKLVIPMVAMQGRSIITVEFEGPTIGLHYKALCKLTFTPGNNYNGTIGKAPARVAALDNDQFVWFYASDDWVKTGTKSNLEILIYEKGTSLNLKDWSTNPTPLRRILVNDTTMGTNTKNGSEKLIKIKNGIDRWGKIVITEKGLSDKTQTLKMDLDWTEVEVIKEY